jgi:hypothetical protein
MFVDHAVESPDVHAVVNRTRLLRWRAVKPLHLALQRLRNADDPVSDVRAFPLDIANVLGLSVD